MLKPFANEPYVDFSKPEIAAKMEAALAMVKKKIAEKKIYLYPAQESIASLNPSKKDEVIGIVPNTSRALAETAVQSALMVFEDWKRVPMPERARYLLKVAKIMRERIFELSAWMVYEVGKNWLEAYADTAEAIDFCEYYAREAMRYESERLPVVSWPDEENELFYIPLGAGVVIPPWNFPLAITCGMTMASIVAGNTVVLKPSSDAPVIAAKFMEILKEVQLPSGVVNFCPARGSDIGDYLVSHPQVRFIAFTGSKEVGLRINELAAKTGPSHIWIKRVILEMGGKDAIIVSNKIASSQIGEIANGIVAAAFGYQGQKCSACSRLIAVGGPKTSDLVRALILERSKNLTVGPVTEKNYNMGPVINEAAFKKIRDYIRIGFEEGKNLLAPAHDDKDGWFIRPTIFEVSPSSRLAQEEIFGPVLSVIYASDFDEALKIANSTQYGLTGAVYSNDRKELERARKEFHAGNLYLNRKCTGAMVGVHPFGGFNMSGTDSKAGGPNYLRLFMQEKAVSEKN
jgi:1-pyrroline-5-carboxylate dehydrogenase